MKILNKFFEDPIEIRKGHPLGFVVAEPEHLKFEYVSPKKKIKKKEKNTKTKNNRQEAF